MVRVLAPAAEELRDVPRRPDGHIDRVALLRALQPAVLLDTADGSGWSYIAPTGTHRLVDDGTRTRLHEPAGVRDLGTDPFVAIDRVCEDLDLDLHARADPSLPRFTGGLVGALAYDLGHRVEALPSRARRDRPHDDLVLWIAEHVVAVDPAGDQAVLVERRLSPPEAAPRLSTRRDVIIERLAAAARTLADARPTPMPQRITTSMSRDTYLRAVEAILARIADGDVFQVNLTQRLTAAWPHDTIDLYAAMSSPSPAPMAACIPALGIASISPETFLAVDAGRVTTRPIKGTRRRDVDPRLDAALADDLVTSTKDRAENVMVVDMERNDLGRVCRTGSVRAPQLLTLEAHPTVWHLVSSITGDLRSEVGAGELLRATFPSGSVTGTPKIAAMGLIDTLEPATRGWYCGAIGYLSAGAADLSVAIRTATLQADGHADFGAGGGIVADSDPAAEHDESMDKASAFLQAVCGSL